MDESRHQRRVLKAAEGYLELELPDQALRELDQIKSPDELRCQYHILRAEAFRQRGEFEAALLSYHKSHCGEPANLIVLMGMAWCYKRTGQLHRSIQMMKRALEIEPENALIQYNLACYYSLDHDKPQALSWLGRAFRLDRSLVKLVSDETDFDPLRNDPDFQYIIETVGTRETQK
ncbi:MAG: hypothetical protein R3C11_13740 [Planctomycetaceae bacterium]